MKYIQPKDFHNGIALAKLQEILTYCEINGHLPPERTELGMYFRKIYDIYYYMSAADVPRDIAKIIKAIKAFPRMWGKQVLDSQCLYEMKEKMEVMDILRDKMRGVSHPDYEILYIMNQLVSSSGMRMAYDRVISVCSDPVILAMLAAYSKFVFGDLVDICKDGDRSAMLARMPEPVRNTVRAQRDRELKLFKREYRINDVDMAADGIDDNALKNVGAWLFKNFDDKTL